MFAILPYTEQAQLYNLSNYFEPLGYGAPGSGTYTVNTTVAQTVIQGWLCPSDTNNGDGRLNDGRSDNGSVKGQFQAVQNYKGCCGSNWEWGDAICRYSFPMGGYWPGSKQGLDQGNGIFMRNWSNVATAWVPLSGVTDGTSSTFLAGEAVPAWSAWTWWWNSNATTATCGIPLNYKCNLIQSNPLKYTLENQRGNWVNNYSFFSRHSGPGANFAYADGHVAFIQDNIDLLAYRYLANRGDEQASQATQ